MKEIMTINNQVKMMEATEERKDYEDSVLALTVEQKSEYKEYLISRVNEIMFGIDKEQDEIKLNRNIKLFSFINYFNHSGDEIKIPTIHMWIKQQKYEEEEKRLFEERQKEQTKKNKKTYEDVVEKMKEYMNTLPQSYTPNEWRNMKKNLNIRKNWPVPRGTKIVKVERSGLDGIKLSYDK